jgi:hypothetical protein
MKKSIEKKHINIESYYNSIYLNEDKKECNQTDKIRH